MSSPYEDELKRLIKEKKSRLRLLKKHAVKSGAVAELQAGIEVLEADLKSYQKAMERYRKNPEPSPTFPPSAPAS